MGGEQAAGVLAQVKRDQFERRGENWSAQEETCLLYTSDAADERSSVDLGGGRIIKKKTSTAQQHRHSCHIDTTRYTNVNHNIKQSIQ